MTAHDLLTLRGILSRIEAAYHDGEPGAAEAVSQAGGLEGFRVIARAVGRAYTAAATHALLEGAANGERSK